MRADLLTKTNPKIKKGWNHAIKMQKGKKGQTKVVLEKDLHKSLVRLLRQKQKDQKFVFFHIKNDVGRRANGFYFDLKPLGVLPGVADFCFLLGKGKTIFLEIKKEKGKLSENQKEFKKDLKDLEHQMFVAYGWEDILEKVTKILNPPKKNIHT